MISMIRNKMNGVAGFIAAPFRLKACGILSMNSRNLDYISRYNPRREFSAVDDKIITKELAVSADIPVPLQQAALVFRHDFIAWKEARVTDGKGFALKPARGAGGGGILIAKESLAEGVILHNGRLMTWQDVRYHANNILSGMFSLGGGNDRALAEELLAPHTAFEHVAYGGIPDVRIIVFRGIPLMAMLRLPTVESSGKANLHMGGIGAGISMHNGTTIAAIHHGTYITTHPDTRESVIGVDIPYWDACVEMAAVLGKLCSLRYIGADIVIDKRQGPMLLELNARPGLAIQSANGRGMAPLLEHVAAMASISEDPAERAAIGKCLAAASYDT